MALFFPRLAACGALLGVTLILPWPLFVLFTEHDRSGVALLGAPPLISGAVAVFHVWCRRHERWLAVHTWPHWSLRLLTALIPVVIFILSFDAPLVLELVFRYPFA